MRLSIDCFPSTRKYIATPTDEPPAGEKADISVHFRAVGLDGGAVIVRDGGAHREAADGRDRWRGASAGEC